MGYYTRYDISNNFEEIYDAINEQSGYGSVEDDSIKWYDCLKDITEVSKKFPNQEVHVAGQGEEQGDVWKAFAKDGVLFLSKAVMEFGPYVRQ